MKAFLQKLFKIGRKDADVDTSATPKRSRKAPWQIRAGLVVLVADFDGNHGHDVADNVNTFLSSLSTLKIQRQSSALKQSRTGDMAGKLVSASDKGRKWLDAAKADLLVWGEVDEAHSHITFRFLPSMTEAEHRPGSIGLGDTLNLPMSLGIPAEDLICGAALAASIATREGHWDTVRRDLTAIIERLDMQLKIPGKGMNGIQFASALTSFANMQAVLWRISGDSPRLDAAAENYRRALEFLKKDDAPLSWALTQNHLASVLEALGNRDESQQSMADAANAYWHIGEVLTHKTHPNDWALSHVRRGLVLYKLAIMRGNRVPQLQEAALALDTALEVFSRSATPAQWAEIVNQLGVILMAIGTQVTGSRTLERALTAFRGALEVRKRDTMPLLWAQTINNLGAAAFALAKRRMDDDVIAEAETCFQGALEVYREHGHRQTVIVIEKNLNRLREWKPKLI